MELDIEERKVAIEAIATLAHIKNTMAELILKPASVPKDIYQSLLYQRDETTGRALSKRQMAPLIIERIEKRSDGAEIIRNIIKIAANWNSFHLAENEYIARATVQKAHEIIGKLAFEEELKVQKREKERLARLERERAEFRKQAELLLRMFDDLTKSDNHLQRGYLLQDLLNRLFTLHGIPVYKSFTRNEGAEQIDGAFRLEGWHYIVECRWRNKIADIRELDGVHGQINRSGKQTMGLFLAINGWSENVPQLLKQNPSKSIILMDGYDLRCVLDPTLEIDFHDFIMAKLASLNLESEPYYGVAQYLKEQKAT